MIGGFVAVAADVADGDLRLLGQLADAADHLAADFGRERRHVQADHAAVVLRSEAEIAGLDRLFDVLQRAGIVRADDDLVRLGSADRGDLLDGRRRAIEFDPQRIDQARIRPAGADAAQVGLQLADRLFHAFFDIEQNFVAGHDRFTPEFERR